MQATHLVPTTLKRALEREIARIEALVDSLVPEAVAIIRRNEELKRKYALTDSVPGLPQRRRSW